jgi:signal peptidase I
MTEGAVNSAHFIETLEDLLGRGHAVRFQAHGWSMHPTIRYGETILVEPLGETAIRTGDVLLYRRSRSAIAHRVVRMTSSVDGRAQFVLRGDAADCYDSPIELQHVLGRVIAVERDGRVTRFGVLSRNVSPVLGRALRHVRVVRGKVAEASRGWLSAMRSSRQSR